MQSDLSQKFEVAIEGMDPRVGKMLIASACKLANIITGGGMKPSNKWPPTPEDLQCLAVALTATNAYREKVFGDRLFDLEFDDTAIVAAMMDDLATDQGFMEFINGQEMEVTEEPEMEVEEMEVEEMPASEESSAKMMNRRSAFLGAM